MPMAELEMKDDIIKENILKSEEDKGRRRGIANREHEKQKYSEREIAKI